MRGNKYETAASLRQAITDRLKKIAKTEGVGVNRLFRHLAFDRFHINALLDKRSLAKFHLDVGVGDAVIEPLLRG